MEVAVLRFENVPEEYLQISSSVKLVDAALLKETLRGAFDEVVEALGKFKSIVGKAKISLERELAAGRIEVDEESEGQFLK